MVAKTKLMGCGINFPKMFLLGIELNVQFAQESPCLPTLHPKEVGLGG